MYTLVILLSFVSVWCLYAASKKVAFAKNNITLTLSRHPKAAKIAALVAFLGSTLLLIFLLGTAIGILASSIVWMIIASCVVLFAPFPKLKLGHLIFILALLLGTELLLKFMS
ncbi:MAG: hypothetical protein AAGA86_06505 [Bacteroidota bacterium]